MAVFIPKAFNKPKRRHPESLSTVAACLLYGPRAGSQRGFGAVSSTTLGFTPPEHFRYPETEPYTTDSSVLGCLEQGSRLHARRGMPGASSFMVFMDPSQGVQNTGEAAPSFFFVRFFSSQEPEFIPRLRNSEPTFLLPRGIL